MRARCDSFFFFRNKMCQFRGLKIVGCLNFAVVSLNAHVGGPNQNMRSCLVCVHRAWSRLKINIKKMLAKRCRWRRRRLVRWRRRRITPEDGPRNGRTSTYVRASVQQPGLGMQQATTASGKPLPSQFVCSSFQLHHMVLFGFLCQTVLVHSPQKTLYLFIYLQNWDNPAR